MDFDRIEDFIINGRELDFNFYGQRNFVAPPQSDEVELYDFLLYVAVKKYNFDVHKFFERSPILNFLPENFLKNCNSFETAKIEIDKLKNKLSCYEVYSNIFRKNETLKEKFERGQKRIASSQWGGGEKIYSSKLRNEVYENSDRLYIPCNSEYCYKFAKLIVEKSIMYGLDFEFKIMNVEVGINGADNIVMYIMGEDFSKYVDMINEIIYENPDITFGKTHMFGYPVNQYIALAPEIGGNSYSGHIRNLLKENIAKYGRNSYCAKMIQNEVIEILNAFDIIEDMDRILHARKQKQ